MSVEISLRSAPLTVEHHLRVAVGEKVYPSPIDILKQVFTVGKLYATQDEDEDPTEVLGFGTWKKVSPGKMTWEMMQGSTWSTEGTMIGYYIWQRTA